MSSVASAERDLASEYVASVVDKYAVQAGPGSAAVRAAEELVPVLREWAGRYLLEIGLSGSYAKGTSTAPGTDIDVFISLSDVAGRNMKDIYWGLLQFLAGRGLKPQAQNVSMRVGRNGVKVDLVPGRIQNPEALESQPPQGTRKGGAADVPQGLKPASFGTTYAALKGRSSTVVPTLKRFTAACEAVPFHKPIYGTCSGYHTLYRRKKDSWMQTNVAEHIGLVSGSGRTREIRALKIWRERNRLDFPSLYLELTVIAALSGTRTEALAGNLRRVLEYLSQGFLVARVVDPANSNNVVSDDLSVEEKRMIAVAAGKTLASIGGAGGYRGPSTPQSFASRSSATLRMTKVETAPRERLDPSGWEQVLW